MNHSKLISRAAATLLLALGATGVQAVDVPAGRYLLKPAHSFKCLDVSGATAQVVQKACTSAAAQQFDVVATNGGYYRLTSVSNGKALDVASNSSNDGAALQTFTYGGGNNQQFMFLRNGAGYVLKARHSGKCAEIAGWNDSDAGPAQQLTCSGGANQTFALVPTGGSAASVPDGRYRLRVAHSNLCLDVPNSQTGNSVQLQQYTCNGTAAQQFDVTWGGNSRYELRNVNSGRCVDVAGGWTVNGTAVQQYDCNQSNAQRWQLEGTGDGSMRLRTALDTTKVVDVSNVSTAPGAAIHLWAAGTGANQKWFLDPVVYSPNLTEGTYSLRASVSGKCLDVPSSSTANAVQLQQYTCSGSNAQRFKFEHMGDGWYRLTNVNSGLALHVGSFQVGNNGAVQQFEANGGDQQLFTFVPIAGGYQVKPKFSYKCLDISGGSLVNGALVQQYTCNQSSAQTFSLQ